MPLIRCPHCATSVGIHPDDAGYKVLCPGCHSAFQAGDAERPPPAPLSPPPPVAPKETAAAICRCTACQEEVTIAVEDVGFLLRCPLCGAHFRAESNRRPPPVVPSETPRSSTRDPYDREDEFEVEDVDDEPSARRRDSDEDIGYILRQAQGVIAWPANGLMWTGITCALLYLLTGAGFAVYGLKLLSEPNAYGEARYTEPFLYAVYFGVLAFPYHLLIAWAGFRMKRLRGSAAAYGGAALALATVLLTLPCNPAMWICAAFGFWTLVAMSKREVKDAIRINQGRELS